MYGTATTNYIAGSITGGLNNVVIRATVQDTTPAVTTTATLTVGGQALWISLATGPTIQKLDPNKYRKDYVALVTGAGGTPVENAVVTATVTPQYYMKGYYDICARGTAFYWCRTSSLVSYKATAPTVPACANEDGITQNPLYDFNGVLDPGEDQNANSRLDPGNMVSVTATTTDSTGHSTVSLVYARDYASWANVRLEVRASMWGSTTMASQTYELQGAAADYTDITIYPPGRTSPFGSNTTCFAALSALALEPTKISLNWDRSAEASSYNIYRERINPPQAAAVKITNVKATTYFDTVQAGGTYCYEIKPVDSSGGESLLSPVDNRVCAASQPTAPAGVIATSLSPTQINVSWDDAGAVSYRIYRDGIRIQESVTRSIVDSNLSANTAYCYAVSSLNSTGNESGKSSTACATTQLAAPLTPTGLTATGGVLAAGPPQTYKVDLSWNASAGAAVYKLYRSGGAGPVTMSLPAPMVAGTDISPDLLISTTYCYAISALDVNGNESAQSTQVWTATP
jgi:fibronectin type 3 domain-containing protein